jgi:hypothetical protein
VPTVSRPGDIMAACSAQRGLHSASTLPYLAFHSAPRFIRPREAFGPPAIHPVGPAPPASHITNLTPWCQVRGLPGRRSVCCPGLDCVRLDRRKGAGIQPVGHRTLLVERIIVAAIRLCRLALADIAPCGTGARQRHSTSNRSHGLADAQQVARPAGFAAPVHLENRAYRRGARSRSIDWSRRSFGAGRRRRHAGMGTLVA